MKSILVVAALLAAGSAEARGGGHPGGHASHISGGRSTSSSSSGEHWTPGHTTRTGTYVQGHYSTNPNGTRNDNYSTIGNVNPHTGEAGTKPRDGDPQ